jgi:GDP-L-fucose synthase
MNRTLVTGGSGLVGTALKEFIPNAVYVSSADYDLTREVEVFRMYQEIQPHRVIHLAARVGGIIDNMSNPVAYLEENVLINTFMIRYAYEFGVERFLGVLSSCIFPDVSDHYPLKEEDMNDGAPTKTNFAYAMAKRLMATQIDAYNIQYGTKFNYITPCNVYGMGEKDDDNKSHFVAALIKKVHYAKVNGQSSIELFGDGTPLRQFMYAKDLAKVIKLITEKDIIISFNVAPEENLSISEIVRLVREVTENEDIRVVWDKESPNGQHRKDLDNTKFRKFFPLFNFTPLAEGIKEYYEQYTICQNTMS